MSSKFITKSEKETTELGIDFAKSLENGNVVCLYGELGNGKTTFVQGLARGLGIKKRIISPTFIIIRSYKRENESMFYHVDLYRMPESLDQRIIGLDEVMGSDSIVAIEWSEKLKKLPKKRIDVRFEYLNDTKREVTITKHE